MASRRFTILVLFALPCRSPKSALGNFDPNSVTLADFDPNSNSNSNDNSNAYAGTPIPDLSDTLRGDLTIRLHAHASSWFKPPTDGLTGCLVKMDLEGRKLRRHP